MFDNSISCLPKFTDVIDPELLLVFVVRRGCSRRTSIELIHLRWKRQLIESIAIPIISLSVAVTIGGEDALNVKIANDSGIS